MKDQKWYVDISFKVHFSIITTTMMIAKGIAFGRASKATKPHIFAYWPLFVLVCCNMLLSLLIYVDSWLIFVDQLVNIC